MPRTYKRKYALGHLITTLGEAVNRIDKGEFLMMQFGSNPWRPVHPKVAANWSITVLKKFIRYKRIFSAERVDDA